MFTHSNKIEEYFAHATQLKQKSCIFCCFSTVAPLLTIGLSNYNAKLEEKSWKRWTSPTL